MNSIFNAISEFFYTVKNTLFSVFGGIDFFDIIDILILAVVIYKIIEFFIDSRAKTLIKGILLIAVMYIASNLFGMIGINWILEKIVNYGLVMLAIIFQPELRRGLERVGHSKLSLFGRGSYSNEDDIKEYVNSVCKAVGTMSNDKVGALIVIENKTPLGEIVNTGTVVDASISKHLICNIFYPKSPLHDGAMIISDYKIKAAGCILPLTANQDLEQTLGTRHRAAIGMSENSDAVVIVVSEETGIISLVMNGKIERNFNALSLQQRLCDILITSPEENTGLIKSLFNFISKNKEDKDDE